ncbi:hypothetical protein Pint_36123 [Pistacia integerrima]|uniref:Uncharacterized protein n=1 Tax=Pistacia integerrima TaxID=434235 RepID=A0ACC0Y4Z1_9ROSI|nr:hypothetical protein Pint_36123 [Pistacia integerrima]
MSLHIGNLSSRTRRAELERVFRKFGQCDIRLKDGYGFIVYDFPPNAEKALRALQGRNICGQPLTLTRSNKQLTSLKKFTKAARSYEPQYASCARGRDYSNRKLHSIGLQNNRSGFKRPARHGRNFNAVNMLHEDRNYHQGRINDYIQEEHFDYREDILDEGRNVEPDVVENDRWGAHLYDQPNDNSVDYEMEDRFERYQGYDRKREDENHHMPYYGVSHAPRSPEEIMGGENLSEAHLEPPNDLKSLEACYYCGGLGHKMCSCTMENVSKRNFKTIIRCRHGDDIKRRAGGKGKLERYESSSHGKGQSSKDSISLSRLGNGRKAPGIGRHHRLKRNSCSPEAKETDRVWRKDQGGKKQRRDDGTQKNHSEKEAKRSVSFPLNSDCTESISHSSQSSKPVSRSYLHFRSRSISSRERSASSDSRSSSTSCYSRSTYSKSISRSSSHTSLSVSVSLGQPLPMSPNKVQPHLNGHLDNAATSEPKEILVEQGLLVGDARLEDAKLENNLLAMRNENVVSSSKLKDEMDQEQPMKKDDEDNHKVSLSFCEITNPSTPLPEKVLLTPGSLSLEPLNETKEFQHSEASLLVHIPVPIENPNSEALGSSHSGRSISVSSEEMCMVLKHYGMKLPDENERHSPVGDYFGSSRLWPWEMIYYRRLKKGPISTENYSRRVAQNQEFGIIDKYIRSSSGWGESVKDYP